MKKSSSPDHEKNRPTPSPNDNSICWQCQYINPSELGYDMLPDSGGHCVCKGWTDDVFGDACDLFKRKMDRLPDNDVDPMTKEDWDNINKM